jgi:hypothetical protein
MQIPGILLLLPLLLLGATGAVGQHDATPVPRLDADCVQFLEPAAVSGGEIVYTGFTQYADALAQAAVAWSPERGFAIPLREIVPAGGKVPPEANLVVRDLDSSASPFKGVTVTWEHAPATITLNSGSLPAPESANPADQATIRAVLAHEMGHALGLGDVPPPGVTIRECANMLMKRSVDKGGGALPGPQPGDIALYCLRWGGRICDEHGAPMPASSPPAGRGPRFAAATPIVSPEEPRAVHRLLVVTCEALPPGSLLPADVRGQSDLAAPPYQCAAAPAGTLLHARRDDGIRQDLLTDARGEVGVALPAGVGAEIGMPAGSQGRYPSLVGYQPAVPSHRISSADPRCAPGTEAVCDDVYLLVPQR